MDRILALETSTAHASVAVFAKGQVLATESSMSQRTHSEFLNPAIERCLNKSGLSLSDIDVFAAGLGPGSFTGLRVAGNIAKAFSMTFQKPLVVVDSLTLMMREARRLGAKQVKILTLINAHKNMVYGTLFNEMEYELGPFAWPITELNQMDFQSETPVLCVGEGFYAYEKIFSNQLRAQIVRDPNISDYPLASTLALVAAEKYKNGQTIEWKSFQPLYIRASEAEENQRVKRQ